MELDIPSSGRAAAQDKSTTAVNTVLVVKCIVKNLCTVVGVVLRACACACVCMCVLVGEGEENAGFIYPREPCPSQRIHTWVHPPDVGLSEIF